MLISRSFCFLAIEPGLFLKAGLFFPVTAVLFSQDVWNICHCAFNILTKWKNEVAPDHGGNIAGRKWSPHKRKYFFSIIYFKDSVSSILNTKMLH